MTYETKADALDAVFETVVENGEITALKAEMMRLSNLVTARSIERPMLAGTKAADAVQTGSVAAYLRKGDTAGTELKQATIGVGPKGGVAVPEHIDAVIDRVLRAGSPIRELARVVDVGTSIYSKLVTTRGIVSGWVSEIAARPDTDTPDFAEIVPPMGELYANPSASQQMLDDALFDVEAWLGEEVGREFARAEGIAFVGGDGVNKPKGFLSVPNSLVADTTRPFGTLQFVNSGTVGAFTASNPQDKLIDLVHALAAPYRQGASWVMNSATLARIRKMKDGQGAFLWQPALSAEQPQALLGYPVVEVDAMPDIAVDSLSIAFGNFEAGYLVVQRRETVVLRDPFSNKPFVQFYATKRVGGTVIDSRAIKLMKFAV